MIIKKLEQVKNALLTVPVNLFHYYAAKKPDKYIVWSEKGEQAAIYGEDNKQVQILVGIISYFTKTENDENVDLIQSALREHEIIFLLDSVEYDESTGFIRYDWEFKVW